MTQRDAAPAHDARTVAALAVRGSASVAVASYAGFLLSFAATAVIARYVGPDQFGSYGLAQAYMQVLVALGGFAFTQAVLQADVESPALADTAMVLTLGVRALLFALSIPLAWIVERANGPAVAGALVLLSGVQFLEAARVAMSMPLQRRVEFGTVARLTLAGSVVSQLLAVGAAMAGWGASALVLRDGLASIVPLTILLVKRGAWRLPSGSRIDAAAAREAWRFGRSIWLIRLFDQGFARLDRVVMGALFSLDAVGIYQQARYLGSLPSSAVAPGNLAVALSTYSRVRHDPPRLAKAFDLVQFFVLRIVPPFAIVCAVFPELLVDAFLGPKWIAAKGALRAVAVYALLLPVVDSYRTLAEAQQHWRVLRWGIAIQSLVAIGLTFALARFGATGAVLALAAGAVSGVGVLAVASRDVASTGGARRVIPVLAAATAAVAVGLVLKWALGEGVVRLGGAAAGSIAAYLTALWLFDGAELRRRADYVVGMLRERGGARG